MRLGHILDWQRREGRPVVLLLSPEHSTTDPYEYARIVLHGLFTEPEEQEEYIRRRRDCPVEQKQLLDIGGSEFNEGELSHARKVGVHVVPAHPGPQPRRDVVVHGERRERSTPDNLGDRHCNETEVAARVQGRIGVAQVRGECESLPEKMQQRNR